MHVIVVVPLWSTTAIAPLVGHVGVRGLIRTAGYNLAASGGKPEALYDAARRRAVRSLWSLDCGPAWLWAAVSHPGLLGFVCAIVQLQLLQQGPCLPWPSWTRFRMPIRFRMLFWYASKF